MTDNKFYVVGIGASAGGYEALKEFFANIPEKPGVAFIVIQHLARDYKSLTDEFLERYSQVKVHMIRDEEKIQPNCIYIMPENMLLSIENGHFKSEERESGEKVNLAIDMFFHALGEQYKERAIGIILSGSGTDGSRGALTIKEKGGVIMVQEPESATFDGMPNTVIATDHPDYILPPGQLAESLMKYIQNPHEIGKEALNIEAATDSELANSIIDHVSDFSRVNFKNYKINTILRRIEKRIKINHLHGLADYHEYVKKHQDELHILYNDLLIGVTNFFRDADAYKELAEKVIPELCKGKSKYDTLRVWVIASSTGEEAYSVAILLDEHIQKNNLDLDYKIFATDLDNKAIEMASMGRYRNNIEADVSLERLNNYFTKSGDFYEVKKNIRKRIIFSRHNLLSDPPFIRLDMVACRNLFIYLKNEIQKKLLWNFNYALKPGGFLFLGVNESSDNVDDLFAPVSLKHKIFKNKIPGKYMPQIIETNLHVPNTQYHPLTTHYRKAAVTAPDTTESYAELIVNAAVPPCILINNNNNEVTYTGGDVDKYLHLPKNKMRFDIYGMIDNHLALVFRKGIRKINHGEQNILFKDVPIDNEGTEYVVNISFKLVSNNNFSQASLMAEDYILVTFQDRRLKSQDLSVIENYPKDTYSKNAIEELEQELKHTKKELQFTVDELETINEELQASNEEMISANEELQSTNEELQSSNEELHTVNIELKSKVDELTSLHNDINNLFINTEIATIFLDKNLDIRKFTPAAKAHFNFRESDVGRPINHLTHNFEYDEFYEDAQKVLEDLRPIEKQLRNSAGRYFIVRILPYKTEEVRIMGVVITLVDVTELKEAQLKILNSARELEKRAHELEKSEYSWRSLVNNTPDIIVRFDKEARRAFVNKSFERVTGKKPSEFIGHTVLEKSTLDRPDQFHNKVLKVLKDGKPLEYYFMNNTQDGLKHFYTLMTPEFEDGEHMRVKSVLAIVRDITRLRQYEEDLKRSHIRFKSLVDNTPDIIARFNSELVCTFMSQGAKKLIGRKNNDIIGEKIENLTLPDSMASKLAGWISEAFNLDKKLEKEIQYPLGPIQRYALVKLVPEKFANSEKEESMLVIMTDVSALKEKEQEVISKNKELESVNKTLDNFVHTIAHDLRSPVANMKILLNLMEKSGSDDYKEALTSSIYRLDERLSGLLQIINSQFNIEKIVRELYFKEIIERVKAEFQIALEEIGGSLSTELNCKKINYIEAYLESIIQNLVSNAIKYRRQDEQPKVKISTEKLDGHILLSVEDNGNGIDLKKYKNHLFKPFKRFSDDTDGKGIGLHVIKTMVERNGGRIEVESIPGDGSVFKVYLKEY